MRAYRLRKPLTAAFFGTLLLAVLSCGNPGAAHAQGDPNDGFIAPVEQKTEVPEGYVGIYTADDLDNVRNDLESDYILMSDIDLAGWGNWDPIGTALDSAFKGDFDGNGHKITSFSSAADGSGSGGPSRYACLFGATFGNTISNLAIEGNTSAINCVDIDNLYYCYVSGIAGKASWTNFENCVSRVSISTSDTDVVLYVGGIAGDASKSSFSNCANYGSITVSEHALDSWVDCKSVKAGGIVGRSTDAAMIVGCLNQGNVSARGGSCIDSGGIVADYSAGIIARCSNEADIEAFSNSTKDYGHVIRAGGIAGNALGAISQCSSIGNVSAGYGADSAKAGGVVGHLTGVDVGGEALCDCYFIGDVSAFSVTDGGLSSYGCAGGIAGVFAASNAASAADKTYVARCYSVGSATARSTPSPTIPDTDFSFAGGVVACDGSLKEEGHDFVSCYYSSSGSYSAYHVNDNGSGSPLSPAAMGAASSYDGWDFRNVWQMGNGDYPYPTLRALPGSQPSEDPGHAAIDPLVQLATCELAAFNPGSSWVGQTVDDFLASAPFQARDRAIWNGQDQKYSDFFSAVLKGYEFVSANGEGPKKHVALKDPSTGDIVLALDPHGIITYADSFASILQSDAKGCFDGAMEVCKEVKGANPDSPIHATGGFLGGMAAAYVSNASGSPANVFNASAGYGAKLSWLTQGEFANGNGFEGIDRPLCKNYYASSMSLLYGYGSDVLSSAKIDANPGGSMYRLNSLYEATDDGFALREATESNPEAETKTFYVADAESVLRSVAESVNNLDAGKPDLSFATKSTQLTLGTTGKDVRLTGVEGAAAPYDMLLPQIIYTGSGEGDLMRGGQTADIFVAGSGSSRLIGNEGSDLYVIGDDADVHISDICASDGNVLCKGIMGVMKAIVFANLEQPGKVKEGLEDLLDSAVEILTDTKQDTIVFRNCSFDDMQVALVDAPFPDSDYYEINAGSSTVRVDRRFFLKRDFLIVDASADGESGRKAEGKSLKDLYEEKNGKLAPRSAEPSEGEVGEDAANAVSLHFEGSGVSVSVRDASTGAEIYSFGPDEDFAYSDEYGTFVGCADTHCVDAVYDASKVEVALMGGTTSRIMTSPEVGSGEDCLSYADWITPSEFDELRIEADGGVSLVGVNADGTEKPIASDTIGAGEVDSSTPTETIDISAATAAKIPEQAWTGGTVSPSIEISYGGIALEDGIDFTVSYENNAGPGEAAAIVSGKGLFTGAKRIPFLIYDATPPEPDPEPQPATAERLGGADRYATMALVSQAAFPDDGSCGTVVVARGDDFPDALAASGLAGVTGAQVLLTNTSGLTSATRDEIVRLGATRAFVVGDKNSVSDRAFGEISSLVGGNAVRLGGADRYATALKIYKAGSGGWGSTAIVAIGTKPADALSASPIAYGMKAPIFLANANGDLSPETLGEIAKGGFDTVLVMGSEHSVSAAAERSLERIAPTVRFSGSDRYETSRMVANWALGNGFACSHAVLAAGRDGKFTDALVASSLGGRNSSPLVLIDDGGAVDRCVSEVIAPHRGSIETVFAIGDEHTVSSAAFETVRRAIT